MATRNFKVTSKYSNDYINAHSRQAKNAIVSQITAMVEQSGGRFLRMEAGVWIIVDSKYVKEKVAHALRDVHTKAQLMEAQKRPTGRSVSPPVVMPSRPTLGSRSSSNSSLLDEETCETWEKVNGMTSFLKLPSLEQPSLIEALSSGFSSTCLDAFNDFSLDQMMETDSGFLTLLRRATTIAVEPIRNGDEPMLESMTTHDWMNTMSSLAA